MSRGWDTKSSLCLLHLCRLQPLGGLNLLPHFRIDEGQNGFAESERKLAIFTIATVGARLGQPTDLHEILEGGGIAPVAKTKRVVEALACGAVLVRIRAQR